MNEDIITWEALEFEDKEKGVDWYWALGIITICAVIVAIIYKDYLFAIFITLAGITMAKFANEKPKMISYELSDRGLRINGELFTMQNIKGYTIREIKKGNRFSFKHKTENDIISEILIIESSKQVAPIITIPITEELRNPIVKIFSGKVTEKDLHEPTAHQIMDAIGF